MDYFSFGDRVIMRVISLISVIILHVRMTAIDRSDLSMTLRILVDFIICLDYSIHDSRSLPILNIMINWETWLIILGIYLITILSMLLNCWGKYYYTVTTPAWYTCYIFLLYRYPVPLILYIPVIPVSWLHVDIVTVIITESSQWFK